MSAFEFLVVGSGHKRTFIHDPRNFPCCKITVEFASVRMSFMCRGAGERWKWFCLAIEAAAHATRRQPGWTPWLGIHSHRLSWSKLTSPLTPKLLMPHEFASTLPLLISFHLSGHALDMMPACLSASTASLPLFSYEWPSPLLNFWGASWRKLWLHKTWNIIGWIRLSCRANLDWALQKCT